MAGDSLFAEECHGGCRAAPWAEKGEAHIPRRWSAAALWPLPRGADYEESRGIAFSMTTAAEPGRPTYGNCRRNPGGRRFNKTKLIYFRSKALLRCLPLLWGGGGVGWGPAKPPRLKAITESCEAMQNDK